MKTLVTGATGFIGSYLVPTLLENSHDVVATDRIPAPAWIAGNPRIAYHRADFSRTEDVYRLMALARPEKVIHLVSLLVGPCETDPVLAYQINFTATAALLDASHALGVKRFVMTSSTSVFGRGLTEPVSNDAERKPLTVYGQTKVACENLMEWYRRVRGLSCGAVRYPWVYGPGRKTGLTAEFSSKLLDKIAAGEKLVITEPEEKGDWLYVQDAVKSLMLLLEREDHPEIAYNIMGSLHTVREAMEEAQKLFTDAEIEIRDVSATRSPYPAAYDDSAARRDIGWAPDFTLAEGMRAHVETVRKRLAA